MKKETVFKVNSHALSTHLDLLASACPSTILALRSVVPPETYFRMVFQTKESQQ